MTYILSHSSDSSDSCGGEHVNLCVCVGFFFLHVTMLTIFPPTRQAPDYGSWLHPPVSRNTQLLGSVGETLIPVSLCSLLTARAARGRAGDARKGAC